MRKSICLLLLFVFCFLCLFNKKRDNSVLVFNETDYNYNIYSIDVSSDYITTHNLYKNIGDYTIISVSIEKNEIYSKMMDIENYNFDTTKDVQYNIKKLESLYIKKLEDNGLKEEAVKVNYNGVKLKSIMLYVTNSQLSLILENNKFKLLP